MTKSELRSGYVSHLAERADLLVQSVTDYAIYMLDPDGIVVSWNAGAQRFKGYLAEEIIGQSFTRFYEESDRAVQLPQRALRTARDEGRFEAEGWRVRKDGSRFWASVVIDPILEDNGTLIGFAKVTRDLTERRRVEEELRTSEERFRLLVQGVTDYAIYMLDPQGIIASWNAGAERFKGYTESEIIGQHFSRFYTPEDIARGMPQIALDTAVSKGHFEAEAWRIRKDGSLFWANVVIDPLRNPQGDLIGFAKITRDLTERRNAQIALEKAQDAFFQSQKMEAIGQLTGGVAHDFNNLLSAIIGSLDLAEKRGAAGGDITQFLRNARQAAERGATLTQRMLAFARKQDLDLCAVDVIETVRGMDELLTRAIGSFIAIETAFPSGLPPVRADRVQLELALLNLAVNARDAMPDGGRIVISARTSPGDDDPTGEEYVVLSLADSGQGMDDDTLRRATEPFFTTKGVGKGTGLGLSMVQGMAEQCGGRLSLHSDPAGGTIAELWLRTARDEPAATARCYPPAMPSVSAGTLDILAVDDDFIVLMNTVAMLEDMGHRVQDASSGKMALDLLAQRSFDLIVTDYAMPGMNGAELIEAARQLRPEVRAVMVSGYADLPDGGVITVPRLAKPFDEQALATLIAESGAGLTQ